MLDPAHILAASQGESELTKVIIGAVFFLFWVISSIASAVSKKKEQEKRLRARDSIQNPGVVVPPPLPGTARQQAVRRMAQRPQAIRQPPKLQKQPQQRRFASKAPRPLPPKPSQPAVPATTTPAQMPVTATEISATATAAPRRTGSATAAGVHAWLRPMTLRQQFILTEVLQPPLGLRERNDV